MNTVKMQVDPKWAMCDIADFLLSSNNLLLINCVSYESRCKTALMKILRIATKPLNVISIIIEDDECTFPYWRKRCEEKTVANRSELNSALDESKILLLNQCFKFKMSRRREAAIMLNADISSIINEIKLRRQGQGPGPLRCLCDFSCMPSYFSFQLISELMKNDIVSDLIALYTKPEKYPDDLLKLSPLDKTRPEFLPSFGIKNGKIDWIVGIGFDHDSIKNAERIKESLNIGNVKVIVPFPAYKPEYIVRTMMVNKSLLRNQRDFYFSPADNPFKCYQLIDKITSSNSNIILSSFGPKPMGLGFGLAALRKRFSILHVQATNYNPDFSIGVSDTWCYWIKYGGVSSW